MSAVQPLPELTGQHPSLDERICAHLVARGRLKEADLARARRLHEESNEDALLLPLLTRLGLVSEREMGDALSEVMGLPLITAKEFPEAPPPNVSMSTRFLKQHHIVPIAETEQQVTWVVADPAEQYAIQAVELATGRQAEIKVGFRSEIDDLIERYYGTGRSAMGTIVENLSDEATRSEDDIEHLRDLASEAPVIRLVNLVIQRAVEQRASDIHI
ncbi:MAG: type II secretion system protein GspE, partial [Rudaea sp.]